MVSTVLIVLNVCLALVLISSISSRPKKPAEKPVRARHARAKAKTASKAQGVISKRELDSILNDLENIKRELEVLSHS